MAIDQTLKYKIRAVYESHKLSPKKVIEERFPDAGVSHKTVEAWISKEGWVKNKYASLAVALESLLDKTLAETLVERGKDIIHAEVVDNGFPEDFEEEISREAVRKAITGHSLVMMMGENLLRMENFAKRAKSIGTSATFQAALISTYHAIHGKEVRHTFKDVEELSDDDLANMSEEELKQLIIDAEATSDSDA